MNASAVAVETSGSTRLIELVVWCSLLFNWLLALMNTQLVHVSQAQVIVCEIILMAASLLLTVKRGVRREQLLVLCALAIYIAFTLLRFVYAQAIEPKIVRDIAIIFVFLCLGMSYRRAPYRLIYWAGIAIAIVGLLEIFFPQIYGSVFNIKLYYINTRGYTEADFWNPDSVLFLSGTRPGSRFFLSFTNLPRASSVFLEPVSLGNFIIVSLSVLMVGWKSLPLYMRIVWSAVLVILLLISDSRFAFACSLILIGAAPMLRRIPQQFSFCLFFAAIAAGMLLVLLSGKTTVSDDFFGRVAYTLQTLRAFDFETLMGLRVTQGLTLMDSGLAYFIATQSLLCAVVLPVLYSIGLVGSARGSRLYKHSIMIVLALSLLISNSLFSIKIAALLWFSLGAFISIPVSAMARREEDIVLPAVSSTGVLLRR